MREIAQGRLEILQELFCSLVEDFRALGEVHENEVESFGNVREKLSEVHNPVSAVKRKILIP